MILGVVVAQHRQDDGPHSQVHRWIGIAILALIAMAVIACFAGSVWIMFNGDPSVEPAIK